MFTSTGGMGPECLRFHSRLAELIADKKGEHYSRTVSWIRARTSFALLRSALICLRGSRTIRRRKMDLTNADIDIQNSEAAILLTFLSSIYIHIFIFIRFCLLGIGF